MRNPKIFIFNDLLREEVHSGSANNNNLSALPPETCTLDD